jgi:hypothetical protein
MVLVIALVVPAGADRDDTMIVGRSNGGKAYNTSLYSTNNKATLSLYNKNGSSGAPALALHSNIGPAMSISSTDRIVNLNSDYVDGYGATRLRIMRNGCAHDSIGYPGSDWNCDAGLVTLPRAGIVDMTGSVDIQNNSASDDQVWCYFSVRVDGGTWTKIASSDRDVDIRAGDYGICATDAWYVMPSSGDLEVRFRIASIGTNTVLGQSSSWWIYIPD